MSIQRLAVIGGGQMGRALVGGMFRQNVFAPSDTWVVEPSAESRQWWAEHHPDVVTGDNLAEAVDGADIVLLAVKPHVVPFIADQGANFWGDQLVVSIAAGVNLAKLCGWIGHDRVVRVMPNTPSLVGAGASAFCVGSAVTEQDTKAVQAMLSSVGQVFPVSEYQLDAVTGLSGSGPAYVCLIIEALADGGVYAGLPRALAMQLATQTVLGTAKMIAETKQHPGVLKDAVASPGGTTIAGLQVLEQNGVRGALMEAVATAAHRSQELGDED